MPGPGSERPEAALGPPKADQGSVIGRITDRYAGSGSSDLPRGPASRRARNPNAADHTAGSDLRLRAEAVRHAGHASDVFAAARPKDRPALSGLWESGAAPQYGSPHGHR